MEMGPRAVAVISAHADPLAPLGSGQNGGMNLAVRRLCDGLAARGIPTDVFTRLTERDQPREELIAPGSRLVRLEAGPIRQLPAIAVVDTALAFADAVAAHAASEQREYRMVHGHHWVSGLVTEDLTQRWSVPWLQSFHTLARTKIAAGIQVEAGRADVEERLVREADRLVAMSRSEAADLVERYYADAGKVCVIEPGADLSMAAPRHSQELQARLGLNGHRVILYVARLEPLKGTDTLLEAIACLCAGDGFEDVVALLVGDDAAPGERDRLVAIAADRGIGDRVRFIGSVDHDDLADYYAVADVCVVPSRAETWGLVALEAQAAGTPVVAANVGGLAEIVADGETGILVPSGDVAGFCREIARVLDDPELGRRMGEAGRRRAGWFTWERAAARLDAVYSRLERGETVPCAEV